jgi:hypothetical protein
VVPREEGRSRSRRQVVLYRRIEGERFHSFSRQEWEATSDSVIARTLDLLATSTPRDRDRSAKVVDVLICGHGRRDACCGSSGTALFRSLCRSDAPRLPSNLRIWRTSHLGGHRFAPTAVTLPDGCAWAFLDVEGLSRIIRREGPVSDLAGRYRGSTGMPSPQAQALEREAFVDVGWDWLGRPRAAEELPGGVVRIVRFPPAGGPQVWTGVVRAGRAVPVPDCGTPGGAAAKTENELHVDITDRPGPRESSA